MVQQFDEFMQHDGDGWNTHAMLWRKQDQDENYFLKNLIFEVFAIINKAYKDRICHCSVKTGYVILTLIESTGPTLYMQ